MIKYKLSCMMSDHKPCLNLTLPRVINNYLSPIRSYDQMLRKFAIFTRPMRERVWVKRPDFGKIGLKIIGVGRSARLGGGQTGPARPPTRDNNMKYTIGNVITGVQGAEPPEASGFSQNSDQIMVFWGPFTKTSLN